MKAVMWLQYGVPHAMMDDHRVSTRWREGSMEPPEITPSSNQRTGVVVLLDVFRRLTIAMDW